MTRRCTWCEQELGIDQIVFSSDYPALVRTRRNTLRAGQLKDAERVWCSAECSVASWAARK